ncbi:MAG: exodeoxyribonuclease V subunit alpha [Xanthomonadales bacterium]|nr:exodeoxyribonuclease V subunit alpha [Xanthomonadales bacterium]
MIYANYLERCVRSGHLRQLDYLFADRLTQLAPLEGGDAMLRDVLFATVVLAARAVGEGGSCLTLERLEDVWPRMEVDDEPVPPPKLEAVRAALAASDLCASELTDAPLVLQMDRLYLLRYARYETDTADRMITLARRPPEPLRGRLLHRDDPACLWRESSGEVNWQAVACAVAASRRLGIISGGPGTGKTHTMVRLLLTLLTEAQLAGADDCRIALAAPTGKAAQRMAEAVRQAVAPEGDSAVRRVLEDPWIAERLPREAVTVHRLLGANPNRGQFRHDESHPLNVDTVVVDEASMLDLPIITRLLRALPEHARLVLIGDRSQLAAVEAGDVFGALFRSRDSDGVSESMAAVVAEATGESMPVASDGSPLADCTVVLKRGFRTVGAVSELAEAVNRGDARETVERLSSGDPSIAFWSPPSRQALAARIQTDAVAWFRALREADSPGAALEALQRFRLLAAVNRGPAGVEQLNRLIERALAEHYGFYLGERNYHLRPILVTRNDYRSRLFNGDLGVIFDCGEGPRAWFEVPERDERGRVMAGSTLLSLLPTALPEHQTCYAMTVHKSQGSEFDAVTLVLPETDSPVVTRELVYTGVTRCRQSVELWAKPEMLLRAVAERPAARMSGIDQRLLTLAGSD